MAPTPTATTSDPQAIALAAKALVALIGGKPITDVTLTGTATRTAGSDIETGTITMQALGYANSRIEFASSAGNRTEIRNVENGTPQGSWVGIDGVSHTMTSHNCMTDAVWFFPAFSILSQKSPVRSSLRAANCTTGFLMYTLSLALVQKVGPVTHFRLNPSTKFRASTITLAMNGHQAATMNRAVSPHIQRLSTTEQYRLLVSMIVLLHEQFERTD